LIDEIDKRELIISPTVSTAELATFISKLHGIEILYVSPKLMQTTKFKTMYDSEEADLVVCRTIDALPKIKQTGKKAGFFKRVLDDSDIQDIMNASDLGAHFVIVEAADWKIIPLENIVARLHTSNTKVYTVARNAEEVRTMFGVLEIGVDGVILETDSEKEILESRSHMKNSMVPVRLAKITKVVDVGMGERVCVDTTSLLSTGEGMLVGSKSNFLFLVHNESVGSSFTSPRPFRVNAGAIHCYTLVPDNKTKYLSEIEAGTEILVINAEGNGRRVTVGRSKIETRPLRLIEAQVDAESGTVILQNAETIRLVKADRSLLSITDAKIGDMIFTFARPSSGRHFGLEVQEHILEK
jgi:3-dehydroquinate synthase II